MLNYFRAKHSSVILHNVIKKIGRDGTESIFRGNNEVKTLLVCYKYEDLCNYSEYKNDVLISIKAQQK